MPRAYRDKDHLLHGELHYGGEAYVNIVDGVLPVLYPCVSCRDITFHVLGSEHAGLCIRIPIVGKRVASTHKKYGLLCNDCTTLSGLATYDLRRCLEARVIPKYVCDGLDRCLAVDPKAPPGYSSRFAQYMASLNPEWSQVATIISAYRRYDGR
jgi:hypothetical protein